MSKHIIKKYLVVRAKVLIKIKLSKIIPPYYNMILRFYVLPNVVCVNVTFSSFSFFFFLFFVVRDKTKNVFVLFLTFR